MAQSQTQRDALARLIDQQEATINAAWVDAQRSVAAVTADFVAAYAAEYQRVSAKLEAESDDGEVDPAQRAAQLRHWLITSGWRARLTQIYQQAAQEAARASLAVVTPAQADAVDQGKQHARALLVTAMQPLTRAGVRWRPKTA